MDFEDDANLINLSHMEKQICKKLEFYKALKHKQKHYLKKSPTFARKIDIKTIKKLL